MPSLNDNKLQALRELGYEGTGADMELAWLSDLISERAVVNDLWIEYLTSLGYTGTLPDMKLEWVNDLGHNSMNEFWAAGAVASFLSHAFNPNSVYVDGQERYLQTTNTAFEPTGGRINFGTELTIAMHFSAGEVSGLSSRRFFASTQQASGNNFRLLAELMSYGTMRYTVKFSSSTRTSIFETTEEFFDDGTDRTIVFSYDGVAEEAKYSINGAAPGAWRSTDPYMPGNATPPDWGEFSPAEYTTYGSAGSDDDIYGRGLRNAEVAQFLVHDKYLNLSVAAVRERFYKNGKSVDYGPDGVFIFGEDALIHIKNSATELNSATVGGTLTSWAKYGDDFVDGEPYSFEPGVPYVSVIPQNTIADTSRIGIPGVVKDPVTLWPMDEMFPVTAGNVNKYWPLDSTKDAFFENYIIDMVDNIYPDSTRFIIDLEGSDNVSQGLDHWDFNIFPTDATEARRRYLALAQAIRPNVEFFLYNPPWRNSIDGSWATDESVPAAVLNPLLDSVNNARYYRPNQDWFPYNSSGYNSWVTGLDVRLSASDDYYTGKDVWIMMSDLIPEAPVKLTGYQFKALVDVVVARGRKIAYWTGRSRPIEDVSPGVIEVLQGVPITGAAPTITTNPTTQSIATGATLTLTAAADDVVAGWWYKDGVAIVPDYYTDPPYNENADPRISGQNTDTLVITNVNSGDAGDYTWRAMGDSEPDAFTSAATITVT